jgi:tellurite resistance protein
MSSTSLLDAVAHAFAMVSFSDGRLELVERARFGKFCASDPALAALDQADVPDAWAEAIAEVQNSPSFGDALLVIRNAATTDMDKAVVMRAAQAALIADDREEEQENIAIAKLAEALGLDPDAY